MMIIRSIEVGLACNHPNWICCGDYNASRNIVGEACADAQQMFGLVQVPTVMGVPENGIGFFIPPRRIKNSAVRMTRSGDNAHNAMYCKVPMLLPRRRYLRDVVQQPRPPAVMGLGRQRQR